MFPLDLDKLLQQLVYNAKQPLIFSSGLFLWLFMGFISIYYLLHRTEKAKRAFVILFSLYFYYKSSGVYFLLLVLAVVVDFNLGNFIHRSKNDRVRKAWVVFSLILNLGLLGYFKYTNFLFEIYSDFVNQPFNPLHIILPVGISFFTFQSLSYTIDIYRKEIKPVSNMLDYAFFVSFFPQLVAGPIVRAKDFIPQIYKPTFISRSDLGEAIKLIAFGLFKKVVISDYISINFVDRIFDNPTLYTGLENLFGVYGYALQIYCDFSGYSDMAIGIALLLGFRFNINFDSPYQSASITEFWRRWHISLSTWLRDYLYISLGGNRNGRLRTYLNQFITMVLGGLWHGASFKFILWGMMHGLLLGLHKFKSEFIKTPKNKIMQVLGVLFTFHFVCFCWIFFRAADMHNAGEVISQILYHLDFSVFTEFVKGYNKVFFIMVFGYLLHFTPKSWEHYCQKQITNAPLLLQVGLMLAIIILVVQVKSAEIQPFIYFQF